MKAAVFHHPGSIVVEDVPEPEIGDDEILVQVRAASICGTDLRIAKNGHFRIPSGQRRVLGHEVAGDIIAVGSSVTRYRVGQRVSVTPNVGCGTCPACLHGLNQMCPDYEAFGISLDGGFQERLRVPGFALQRGNVFEIPDGVSYEEAALVEPLSCCYSGQRKVDVNANDTMLIMGAGPIGAFHVMLGKLAGARRIIVSNNGRSRLEFVQTLGADVLVDLERSDLAEVVARETGGAGVEVVITAVSAPQVQSQAVDLLATHGRVNFFAGLSTSDRPVIDTNRVHYRGLVLTGTTGSSNADYAASLRLVGDRRIDLSRMISAVFPIERIDEAFDHAAARRGMKAVVRFD